MSYGTDPMRIFASKAALKRAVENEGAEMIMVRNTSFHDDCTPVTLASLVDTPAVIVGPLVETQRKWYANVRKNKSGKIIIV